MWDTRVQEPNREDVLKRPSRGSRAARSIHWSVLQAPRSHLHCKLLLPLLKRSDARTSVSFPPPSHKVGTLRVLTPDSKKDKKGRDHAMASRRLLPALDLLPMWRAPGPREQGRLAGEAAYSLDSSTSMPVTSDALLEDMHCWLTGGCAGFSEPQKRGNLSPWL